MKKIIVICLIEAYIYEYYSIIIQKLYKFESKKKN